MKSYLLSQLVQKFARSAPEGFEQAHRHDWLVWEPGTWKPADKKTALNIPLPVTGAAPPPPVPSSAEGLAMALERAAGKTTCSLGRGEQCDVVISDGTISTQHLLWSRSASGEWTAIDSGSRNGTFLNGRRLQPREPVLIRDGTSLQVGNVIVTFYSPRKLFERLRASRGS